MTKLTERFGSCSLQAQSLAQQLLETKEPFKNKNLAKFYKDVEGIAQNIMMADPMKDREQAFMEATEHKMREAEQNARKVFQDAKLDAMKKVSRRTQYQESPKWLEGVDGYITPIERKFKGAKDSIDSLAKTTGIRFLYGPDGLLTEMKNQDVEEYFLDNANATNIANEVEGVDTGDENAKKVAQIIKDKGEQRTKLLNAEGANRQLLEGRIARTKHDIFKMMSLSDSEFKNYFVRKKYIGRQAEYRDACFERWYNNEKNWWDFDKTMPEVPEADRKAAMREFFDDTVNQVHERLDPMEDITDKDVKLTEGFSLTRKINKHRTIHYKQGKWLLHQEKYGGQSLKEAVIKDNLLDGHNLAILKRVGTNFGDALRQDVEIARIHDGLTADSNKVTRVKNRIKELEGATQRVANYRVARFSNNVRNYFAVMKLGASAIHSISDIANGLSYLNNHGMTFGKRYMAMFEQVYKGITRDKDRRIFADLIRFSTRDQIGYQSRFGSDTSKMMNSYFKAVGLQGWDSFGTSSIVNIVGKYLVHEKNTAFKNIVEGLRDDLEAHNIGEKEWDVLRKSTSKLDNGDEIICSDSIRSATDDLMKEYLGDQKAKPDEITKAKQEIEDRLSGFYYTAEQATVTLPSIRERSLMHWGLPQGHPIRAALDFMTMFRSFPIAYTLRVLQPIAQKGIVGAFLPAMELALNSMILNGLSRTAVNLLRGKTTDWESPEFWAMNLIPAAGLISDLIPQRTGYGTSYVVQTLGPVAEALDDLVNLGMTVGNPGARNYKHKATRATFNFLRYNMVPNYIYTRGLIDHYLLNRISDHITPGSTSRAEQRLKRETGSEPLSQYFSGV